jgi:hypothetical protein
LSSCVQSKYVKIKIYKIIILTLVRDGREVLSHKLLRRKLAQNGGEITDGINEKFI